MEKPNLLAIALTLLVGVTLLAQEKEKRENLNEIIISATKFEEKKENTAKIVYQITQKDIEKNPGSSVSELINRIPGLEIRGLNTNPTEPRSLFVRGGRARQVLILIDGIPVSDPSGINQEFDLRFLALNQIEKIEVLKGASSTLYGTGAATGVINIILKKASSQDLKISYETSTGTNNSIQNADNSLDVRNMNTSIACSNKQFNIFTSFNLQSTTGQSSAIDNAGNFDLDPFSTENFLLKVGYQISKELSFSSFLQHDHFRFDYDNGGFSDSNTNNGKQLQTRVGLNTRYDYKGGELVGNFSFNRLRRTDFGLVTSIFEGESKVLDVLNKLELSRNEIYLITGLNYQEHNNNTTSPYGNIVRNIASFNLIDPYASIIYTSDFGFNANFGGRLNIHSEYGNHFVYDLSLAQNLFRNVKNHSLKLIASYSSAFIAPSTYQLFSDFGNLDLQPETSSTVEFGFDANFLDKLQFNSVYFKRRENDAIVFRSINVAPFGLYQNTFIHINVDGIETEISYLISNTLNFYANYTYTNKEQDVDYIPTHKWLASLEYNSGKNLNSTLVFRNVGDRSASFFDVGSSSVVSAKLGSYRLLDFNVSYKFNNDKITLFGQLTNLFNEDFQDILGFTTHGRNFLIGLRLNI